MTEQRPTITWRQALSFRMRRHHLSVRAPRRSLVEVARDVCGVQAQVMSAAQLALRARVKGLTKGDIDRALWRDRTLVKTSAMRGSLHLLATPDLQMVVGGLRRWFVRDPTRLRRWSERDPPKTKAMTEVVLDALSEGPRTLTELTARVVARLGEGTARRIDIGWGRTSTLTARIDVAHIVRLACMQGRVCFGPNRGPEATFVRLRDWAPDSTRAAVEDGETSLLRRYLHAYGPATPQDFASWTGMAVGDGRQILRELGDEAIELDVEGVAHAALRNDAKAAASSSVADEVVALLPSFDPYLLAHRNKEPLVPVEHYKRVYRPAAWLSPVVLVDGRAAGVWSHERKGKRLGIRVEPFRPFTRPTRDRVQGEAEDIARFLELEADVRFQRGPPA